MLLYEEPNGGWSNANYKTGIRRGTILHSKLGDPMTPGWPAKQKGSQLENDGSRYDDDGTLVGLFASSLPTIAVQPIGNKEAKKIMEKLEGEEAPNDWHGNLLRSAKYKVGSTSIVPK